MTVVSKYNTPVPRYTSYPTVPYWQQPCPSEEEWIDALNRQLSTAPEISLYLHLPFCDKLCTYCGCNKRITRNHGMEGPYVDALLGELDLYLERLDRVPRLGELHLGGGTPTFFAPGNLARLVDGILERLPLAESTNFGFEAHPASTTRKHLRTLAGRGFRRISVGVQDFNPNILRIINREQTEAEVIRCVAEARDAGYTGINFDLIYGLPTQRTTDIEASVAHVKRLRPDRIAFYGYAHVPWVSPGQRAYDENDLPRGQDKWLLYQTGRRQLEELGYRDIGLDHFALPDDELSHASRSGALHRNFMGYTTANHPVTLALGCSAIGDCWEMYAQNEKQVEPYQSAVRAGRLPLVRGHRLSPGDQKVRRHILNLMCQGATSWRAEDSRCPAIDRAAIHWNDMATDGLLKRSPYRVDVLPAGRPFLRNICLPLDDHYWQRQPGSPTFSRAI